MTTLHNFNHRLLSDGSKPYAGLIQARDGNLYGTTDAGGIGDRSKIKLVNAYLEIIARRSGNTEEADRLSEENSRIERDLGLNAQQQYMELTAVRLAHSFIDSGDIKAARKCYQDAIELARKDGVTWEQVFALDGAGEMEVRLGNVSLGNRYFEQALSFQRKLGSQGESWLLYELLRKASRMRDQAKLSESKMALHESMALADRMRDQDRRAEILSAYGDLFVDESQLEKAVQAYEEELAIYSELGQEESVAAVRLDLATIAIERGDPASAESAARKALALARKDDAPWNESRAETVLASALFAQSRLVEAQREVENAKAIWRRYRRHEPNADVDILSARIDAAVSKPTQAVKELNDVVATNLKLGNLRYVLLARLALAECEISTGQKREAAILFASVHRLAKERGFILTSRKATAAAAGLGS